MSLSVAASGTVPFTYRWYKNGAAITGATGATYGISSVKTTDAGTYYAVVSNAAGSATSDNAILTVQAAPVFTTQPKSLTVALGLSATFSAVASGTPTPTYQWKRNGVALSGATKSSYTIATVTASSAATYTVVATNAAGSATSSGAVLTIASGNSGTAVVVAAMPFLAVAAGPMAPAAGGSVGLAAPTPAAGGASMVKPVASAPVAGSYTLWRRAGPDEPDPEVGDWRVTRIDSRSDGETDILWQETVSGRAELWIMDGMSLAEVIPLVGIPVDASHLR